MADSHPDLLIDAYLAGELSPGEAARVEAYLAAHPGRAGFMAGVRASVRGDDVAPDLGDRDERRRLLLAAFETPPATARPTDPPIGGRRPVRWGFLAATAAVVLAVAAPSAWRLLRPHPSVPAMTTYATRAGERADVPLPDGSHVMLNVASRLDVPADFGAGNRTVRLSGEAYFTVAHAAGAPFVVRTLLADATVLGTAFGVRAYDVAHVRVAVRDGRVGINGAVAGARDVVYVQPGRTTVVRDQSVDAALGFTSGRLTLINVPLRDAVADLERWYDVELRVADPALLTQRVTIAAAAGSADDLARWLRTTFEARTERSGRVVTVHAR